MTRRRRQHPAEQDEQRQPDELDPARNLDPRRHADGRIHAFDRTTGPRERPPPRPGLGLEPRRGRRARARSRRTPGTTRAPSPLHARATVTRLKPRRGSDTVRAMSPPQASGRAVRHRPAVAGSSKPGGAGSPSSLRSPSCSCFTRARHRLRRRRRLGCADDSAGKRVAPAAGRAADAAGDLAARHAAPPAPGEPEPRHRDRLLERRGRRARARRRSARRRTRGCSSASCTRSSAAAPARRAGTSSRAGTGRRTSALDVGAPPRTDVYAPVDGTIVGISKVVLNGRVYGRRIDIQPTRRRRSSCRSRACGPTRR